MNRKADYLTRTAAGSISVAAVAFFIAVFFSGADLCSAENKARSGGLTVELLDGRLLAAESLEVKSANVAGLGLPSGLTLADLRHIELPGDSFDTAVSRNNATTIWLAGGGVVLADAIVIADDRCVLDWKLAADISLPIDCIRSIQWPSTEIQADFQRAMAAPLVDKDQVFVHQQDKLIRISGLVESLTSKELALEYEGERKVLPRNELVGVVLAQTARDQLPQPAEIFLADGSQLHGRLTEFSETSVVMQLPGGVDVRIPTTAVRSMELRSPRMVYLSDLQPIEAVESPIVTVSRTWQRNRSASGLPLAVGGQVFKSGIGVHSHSKLTFALEGDFESLVGRIGLDASAGKRGDCIFKVLSEGETLFSQRMRGHDLAKDLQVDLRGRRKVTLLVEAGEDLDLGDHANWCDVRLIKNAK